MNDNNHNSIQDSLVKDSLQANDKLNSQVQQSLTADTTINSQFTGTATPNDAIPNELSAQSTSGFDKSAIYNPHTEATDGNEETHFGYKTVKKAEKQEKVAEVFTSVAKKYDIMNDLM